MTLPPIDGQTQMVGLVGWPVMHSASPAMQNAAFAALGLNWRYVPLPVRPEQVEGAIRGLAALGFRGANVTVPHKHAALCALDTLGPEARALGAVNTIVIEQQKGGKSEVRGHNTDAAGLVRALREGGFDPKDSCIAVVGAGGAARAAVFGLAAGGATEIVVLNRSPERARTLVSELEESAECALRAEPLSTETLVESVRFADLLINATSVGMEPRSDDSIWSDEIPLPSDLTVFDMVYNPLETKLLRQARRSGAHAQNGLGMLVRQGALAFGMWTGHQAPVEVMRHAGELALRQRAL